MKNKKLENKFDVGDWILISHTPEPEMYLHLDETNVDYYNKIKEKEGVAGPRKAGELEVKSHYEEKIRQHMEEASHSSMMAEVYRYKLKKLK